MTLWMHGVWAQIAIPFSNWYRSSCELLGSLYIDDVQNKQDRRKEPPYRTSCIGITASLSGSLI